MNDTLLTRTGFKQALVFLWLVFSIPAFSQTEGVTGKHTFLLTGASFASPANQWFELACASMNALPLNRAIDGESIASLANRMAEDQLYSSKELDEIDAFIIMHVHNKDVFEDSLIKKNYTDYDTPFDYSNYAAAYDYVIKRYISDCYHLQFNPDSRYYGTKEGKPAVILLCTHWHDARTRYNASVRKLADKWGFPLIEFDAYAGFSKNTPHPVTGQSFSLLYAQDSEGIDGVTYGWHPRRGSDKQIQQHMSQVFMEAMRKCVPIENINPTNHLSE